MKPETYDYKHIRVSDIPPEGLSLRFDLDAQNLAKRIDEPSHNLSDLSIKLPKHIFFEPIQVEVKLNSDGSTVDMQGSVSGSYQTLCGRCAEEAKSNFEFPVFMVLKPRKGSTDGDDTSFSLYDGEVIDCSEVIEELVVLGVPYVSFCSEDCKGLCPVCGKNLNSNTCDCSLASIEPDEETFEGENPFSKLKNIKLT